MDLKSFKFTVFGAPISVNALYYNRGRRGRVLTDEGRRFKHVVSIIAREAMATVNAETTSEPVSIYIQFYFKTRAGDVDNCVKALLDGLKGVVWNDDKQVGDNTSGNYGDGFRFRCVTEKWKDAKNPRTEVSVRFFDI